VQKAVIVVGVTAVLDVDDNPVDFILCEQVKVVVDVTHRTGERLFGFDVINDDVDAEDVFDKSGKHIGLGKGFFENNPITQRGDGLHGGFPCHR
jgi:hypothetical protein